MYAPWVCTRVARQGDLKEKERVKTSNVVVRFYAEAEGKMVGNLCVGEWDVDPGVADEVGVLHVDIPQVAGGRPL